MSMQTSRFIIASPHAAHQHLWQSKPFLFLFFFYVNF